MTSPWSSLYLLAPTFRCSSRKLPELGPRPFARLLSARYRYRPDPTRVDPDRSDLPDPTRVDIIPVDLSLGPSLDDYPQLSAILLCRRSRLSGPLASPERSPRAQLRTLPFSQPEASGMFRGDADKLRRTGRGWVTSPEALGLTRVTGVRPEVAKTRWSDEGEVNDKEKYSAIHHWIRAVDSGIVPGTGGPRSTEVTGAQSKWV
ncbi:hypothetical protein B0H16DRAFT_1482424 [Mycena metata]|uniref:Uncharacterized protein n=1 Tax=Mycena metata TaxID=1033252 RepID=A0AAD7GTP2_9AGAR|nr:hypothetical protein B0H16DRAFT_1482424 [Mycena metata]